MKARYLNFIRMLRKRMKSLTFFFSSAVSIAFKNAPSNYLFLLTFREMALCGTGKVQDVFSHLFPDAHHVRHFPKGFWSEWSVLPFSP
ncbi:MAG: hypothetical protein ABF802_13865 [Acetobacter orientalis]|uniref:hypothetical protein n=1 Tax=Acetobacter orientalis TaxID=146474 RepID=UPI0039ECE79C